MTSVAVIGAHCDDIAIGAGGTLSEIVTGHPDVTVHGLVLSGGGTDREGEERKAFAALCGSAPVRLAISDIPDGHFPAHWDRVKSLLAEFRRTCDPDMVFAPARGDLHQDHRTVAELVPTEFRDHFILGYEILKWESDLPSPQFYQPISASRAHSKAELLNASYPSQTSHDWFDEEAFISLMRLRGVQCRSRYAEAFTCEKATFALGASDMTS